MKTNFPFREMPGSKNFKIDVANMLNWRSLISALAVSVVASVSDLRAQTFVNSIAPAANDISAELPPFPGRLSAFGFQGVPGTTYKVVFKITAEPALVVGVGAQVLATAFDSATSELSVDLVYNGFEILTDATVPLPERSFLVVVDPGITSAGFSTSSGCYGPGSNPEGFKDDRSDFGDDDGLVDPSPPSADDTSLGLSSALPGTFFSTRSFYWCVVPPTAAQPSVGFKVLAAPTTQDALSFNVSPGVADLIGDAAGLPAATAGRLAVASGGAQVSVNVSDTDKGGISFAGNPRFVLGETTLDISFTNAKTSPEAKTLVARDATLIVREALSFAPETTRPTTADFSVSGFVADPAAVGEPIEIVRFQNRRCTSEARTVFGSEVSAAEVGPSAVGGIVIGRDVVKDNGSYSAKIPTSAAFPNKKTNTTLGSRIISDKVQESRQINLSRPNRDNRR